MCERHLGGFHFLPIVNMVGMIMTKQIYVLQIGDMTDLFLAFADCLHWFPAWLYQFFFLHR